MRAGSRLIRARCRNHDLRRFVPEFSANIPLPYPLTLAREPVVADTHEADPAAALRLIHRIRRRLAGRRFPDCTALIRRDRDR